MLDRTCRVFLVLTLSTLILCVPLGETFKQSFHDPFIDKVGAPFKDSIRYHFRFPFRNPFRDPYVEYSFVNRLEQSPAGSESANMTLYRLPQNLKPTKYDLTMVPFLVESNFTFYGKVKIDITAVQDAAEIVMNSRFLTIRSVTLINSDTKAPIDCNYFQDEIYQRLIIKPLKTLLVYKKSFQVVIVYTGLLKDEFLGFYRSSYKIGSQVKWLAVTQFESTHARRAFPCFDEPAFRAVFTVRLGRFEYQNTISNMRLVSTSEPLAEFDNRVIDTYEDSPPMPTYLVGFCVSELLSVLSSDGKLRVSMREDAIEQAKYVIGIGETVLKTISDFVNVPYTLPKMDIIAVPDFGPGAMENWGITMYRERYVLSEEGVSNTLDKQGIIKIVAHEFGHQWFGDLVTPQWWSYTWLNEAFATYLEYKAPDLMDKRWDMMSLYVLEHVHVMLTADTILRTPMTSEKYTPLEIAQGFSYAVYSKGGSVLRMTEHFLTTSVFRTGLHYYLTNSSASGIGTPEHLFSYLDDAARERNVLPSGITVANVLSTWTTQGGFPLLTVNRTGNTILLSQKIYSTDKNDSTQTFWYIPLTYTTQSEANFQDTSANDWLLPGHGKSISTSDNGWVIFNIQQTGFYRVNYDANNWELLTHQLLEDLNKIHVNNRAQLLDDSFSLATTEYLRYHVFLNLTRYLLQEREYVPWIAAARRFKNVLRLFQGTNAGYGLQAYIVSLVRPYYQYLIGMNSSTVTHQTSLARTEFVQWACELGISECETYTSHAFKAWYNKEARIEEDVRSAVLCTGLKLGGDKEWETVWNLYQQATNPSDRQTLLNVLGCTTSEPSIDRYLTALISPQNDIVTDDPTDILVAVASRPTGIPPMIRFVVNNYDAIAHSSSKVSVGQFVVCIGSYLVKDEHLQQVRAIVSNATVNSELRILFNSTLTNAESNRQWVASHQNDIQLWLDQNRTSDTSHLSPAHITILLCLTTLFIVYVKCVEPKINN